jgi:hypothetical protein
MTSRSDAKIRDVAASLLAPGERIELVATVLTGGNPWLSAFLRAESGVPIVVTDRRLLFLKAGLMRTKGALGDELPRGAVEVERVWSVPLFRSAQLRVRPATAGGIGIGHRFRLNFGMGHAAKADRLAELLGAPPGDAAGRTPPPGVSG